MMNLTFILVYWYMKYLQNVQYICHYQLYLSEIFIYTRPSRYGLPCKFVLAEEKNFSADLCNYLTFIFWPAVLQNMLDNVVTILILQEALEV